MLVHRILNFCFFIFLFSGFYSCSEKKETSGTDSAKIEGEIKNLPKDVVVYLSKVEINGPIPIDSANADELGKFCLYVNGKRGTKMYAKLSAVKSAIKKLDKEMQFVGQEPEDLDD